MSKDSGYMFPDPIDPEAVECFKVYIPKDTLYIAAFWRAYEYFTTWHAWARDSAQTGKDVAALWRTLFDQARSEYEAGGGCVTSPEFRIGENCFLEVNCSDDPENPDWKVVPNEGDDPRNRVGLPPYPGEPPAGETNECLAAANIAEFVWFTGNHLSERLGNGAIITEIVVALAGIMATFFQLLTSVILDETTVLFINISPGTIDDDWDTLSKQDFIDLLVCYLNSNGNMPYSNWGDFLDALLDRADDNQAWYMVYYVCALMGIGGMGIAALMGGIETAECASCEGYCEGSEWSRIYRVDDAAWSDAIFWVFGNTLERSGAFVSDDGMGDGDLSSAGFYYNRILGLKISQAGMVVDKIRAKARGTSATFGAGTPNYGIATDTGGFIWAAGMPYNQEFDIVAEWTGAGHPCNEVMFYFPLDGTEGDGGAGLSGEGWIYQIEICGSGNPPEGGTP